MRITHFRMLFWFVFLLLYALISNATIIKKCCNYGESLNVKSECSNETNYDDKDWFPSNPFIIYSSKNTLKIVSNETRMKTIQSVYSGKINFGFPNCSSSLRDSIVAWKDQSLEGQFYLIYDSRKRVKLNIKRQSVYHDNVTISHKTPFTPDAYCVDNGPSESYVALVCPCDEVTCIRKCCHQDYVFDKELQNCIRVDQINMTDQQYNSYKDWRPNFEFLEDEDEEDEVEYYLLPGKKPVCANRGIYAEWSEDSRFFQFDANGNVKVNLTDGKVIEILPGDYCADFGWKSGRLVPLLLRCFSLKAVEEIKEAEVRVGLYGTMLTIAAILMTLAAMTIAFSGELEERFAARPQLAHVACLAVAHFAASFNTFFGGGGENAPILCFFTGYSMQFSFLASFFWLNIMCVDMSYTFSAIRPTSKGTKRDKDRRKFMWYSLYAWGGATTFTLAAIVVDFIPSVPNTSAFKPNLGAVKCWFNSTQSVLLYFYGPMGVLLVVNLCLFVYTTWRIIVMSRGSDALRKGDSGRHGGPSNKEKQRYILYAKMFSLMGVTWLTEIISWAVGGPSYFWYLTDFINLLRAVFIFIIFCWKPRVWNGVKRKYSTTKVFVLQKLGISNVKQEQHTSDHSGASTDSTECPSKNTDQNGLEMKPSGS